MNPNHFILSAVVVMCRRELEIAVAVVAIVAIAVTGVAVVAVVAAVLPFAPLLIKSHGQWHKQQQHDQQQHRLRNDRWP